MSERTPQLLPRAYRAIAGERGPVVESLPRCVFIEVTNRCNLLCEHCPRTFYTYEQPQNLSWETFLRVVDQFPDMERAVLHGIGEPLLNKDLGRMIRHLKGRGVTVLFNSNGTLLTPRWQEELIAAGLDEYRCSLDGADAQTFHRIRGKDLLPKILSNLEAFVRRQRELGAEHPRVSLWCVGMKENIDEVPELMRIAARIGVPEVYLQRFVYYQDPAERRGIGDPEQRLYGNWSEREAAVLSECERLAAELGVAFRASGATDPRSSVGGARPLAEHPWQACRRPWTTAYVTANGNCLACCFAPFTTTDYSSLILGNLLEREFAEVWNGEAYQSWRRSLLSDAPHKACSGCGVCWSL